MSDLIKREDAINALVNLTCYGIEEMRTLCDASVADSEGWLGGIRDAVDEIEALPSAEPERKTGVWISVESNTVNGRCSVCGYESHLYENDVYGEHYCPNCGAWLRLK